MRSRISSLLALTVSTLVLAACGSDDGDAGAGRDTSTAADPQARTESSGGGGSGKPVGDLGGREAAQAFADCFDEDGYAEDILSTPANVGPLLAKTQGYEVVSVLVNAERGAFYSPFVHFFESGPKLQEAKRKVESLKFGTADAPKADERGAAVVEYTTKQAREAVREPILACLG